MPDEIAFLRTILENPDDDGPRLVYADWLEETGATARAEFIRVQIELSHLPPGDARGDLLRDREMVLRRRYEKRWVRSLGRWVRDWEFRRGLLESVRVTGADFVRHGAKLFERAAVTRVRLTNAAEQLNRVAAAPALAWVRELDVGYNGLTPRMLDPLIRSDHFANVQSLDVSANRLGDAGMAVLATRPRLAGLRRLGLSRNNLTTDGVALLVAAHFPNLERLELDANQIGPGGVSVLADSPFAASLRHLVLARNNLGDAGVAELAGAAHLTHLTALNLSGCHIGDDGAVALANSPALAALEDLDLSFNRIGSAGARALASSRHLADLRRLYLMGNALTPAVTRLLERRFGDRLREAI